MRVALGEPERGSKAQAVAAAMTRMTGEATSGAPPEKIWGVLTDAARIPDWFIGAKDVQVGDGWPRVGGRISFRVGSSKLEGRVVESQAPRILVLDVEAPSAHSRVTSRVEPTAQGARYERVVEAEWKGALGPLLGKLVIAPIVRREARKVAKAAEQGR